LSSFVQHPSGIPDTIVKKVVARRGRLHAFETIDPRTTALVVIDLDAATVGEDDTWPRVIATVNTLAATARATPRFTCRPASAFPRARPASSATRTSADSNSARDDGSTRARRDRQLVVDVDVQHAIGDLKLQAE
jgi:nicotinamidase-related amidase